MRPLLFSAMIEKCIAAAKPGVRAKCIEATLLFVEWDTFEPIIVLPLYRTVLVS